MLELGKGGLHVGIDVGRCGIVRNRTWEMGDRKGLGIGMVEGRVKSWERGRIGSCGRVPGTSGAGVGDQTDRISRIWQCRGWW